MVTSQGPVTSFKVYHSLKKVMVSKPLVFFEDCSCGMSCSQKVHESVRLCAA